MNNTARMERYAKLSTSLACLSNAQLQHALSNTESMHEGIGGKSGLWYLDHRPIFIKKIPLSDLEQLPQNFMSTANFYHLPMCYQYGVGSAGFGAWRELATHIMTTNWVISGAQDGFPMLYHWRILHRKPGDGHPNAWGDMEQYCQYWEYSDAIRKRMNELAKASSDIILFLEYIPQNVHDWLSAKIAKGGIEAESAVTFAHKQLKATNAFIHAQGLMHFDAHFRNILTDGKRLYLSDFGLALSSKFTLSTAEKAFLQYHKSYDEACLAVNLLHCIITSLFGQEAWGMHLREYISSKHSEIPSGIDKVIKQYAPAALMMDAFFQGLQKESKSTPYPSMQLETLLLDSQ